VYVSQIVHPACRRHAAGPAVRRRNRQGARGHRFSAHGVADQHTSAAGAGFWVIDATCPLVARCTTRARFARDDYDILLIGHEGHEEVSAPQRAPDPHAAVDGPDAVDDVTVRDGTR
jgi:4-hydroxy-3-methylbut-2-enyl diphosphate reductase